MFSMISALKRKLSSLSPFAIGYTREAAANNAITEETRPTKRQRLDGAVTPMLHPDAALEESPNLIVESLETPNAPGRVLLSSKTFSETLNGSTNQPSDVLRMLPPHVLSKCLVFVCTRSDRFALQTTCTLFQRLSNEDQMLVNVELGGNWSAVAVQQVVNEDDPMMQQNILGELGETAARRGNSNDEGDSGEEDNELIHYDLQTRAGNGIVSTGGILADSDTSTTACQKLIKFSAAGNMQATYMLAVILCYCVENVNEGLALLRLAAAHGDLRSIYNLGLILRDTGSTEASHCLLLAARCGYIPAWQEKLTPTEMRDRFGDLDAPMLSKYLDPPCLNRLLARHYLECDRVKKHQTSHCWNPLCGRWAYKATSISRTQRRRLRGDRETNPTNVEAIVNNNEERYSIRPLLPELPNESIHQNHANSPLGKIRHTVQYQSYGIESGMKVSRMKMCSSCRRAKYCSKLCQVYDWRSGRHKNECLFLVV